MTTLRIAAFLHVVSAVLLTGYALFWVVMAVTLEREEPADSKRLLAVVGASRWPPVGPYRFRLPLPLVGWGIIVALALTGTLITWLYGGSIVALITGESPWGSAMSAKLICFGILLAGQVGQSIRPSPPLAYLNGAATLAILLFAAFLRH